MTIQLAFTFSSTEALGGRTATTLQGSLKKPVAIIPQRDVKCRTADTIKRGNHRAGRMGT